MNNIYIADAVKKVQQLHNHVLAAPNVILQLSQIAQNLKEQHEQGNEAVCVQLSNWHPQLIAKDNATILNHPLTLDESRLTIAREHGFQSWEEAEELGNKEFDIAFENTIDLLLNGEFENLKLAIENDERLLHRKSVYGHECTLLHYAGSNGVETRRQQVPLNLVEMVNYLIEKGADKEAKAKLYGGLQTTLALASTSAHPADAGIMDDLVEALS